MMLEKLTGLGAGAFTGRKELLEHIFAKIDANASSILICGESGGGKTMMMRRIAAHLNRKQYATVEAAGALPPEILLERIFRRAVKKGVAEAARIYFDIRMPLREKILWFSRNFLQREPIAILMDDFHENLAPGGGFHSSRLKEFIFYLRDICAESPSLLVLAGEQPVQGFEALWLPAFPEIELNIFLAGCPGLSRLNAAEAETMTAEIGGKPLLLRWLDVLAAREPGTKKIAWRTLKNNIPRLADAILYKSRENADFSGIILEHIVNTLSEPAQRFLNTLCLFSGATPGAALKAAGATVSPAISRELAEAQMVAIIEKDGLFSLHDLAAGYLRRRLGESAEKQGHLVAARYFASLIRGSGELRDIEIDMAELHHYRQAGDMERLTEAALLLDDHLGHHGQMPLGFDILEALVPDAETISAEKRRRLYRRITMYYALFGKDEELIRISGRWGELARSAGDMAEVAQAHRQMGLGYDRRQKFKEAAMAYEEALSAALASGDSESAAFAALEAGKQRKRCAGYPDALLLFARAQELYETIGSAAGVGRCHQAAGKASEELGRWDQALASYQLARESFTASGSGAEMATLFHEMGNVSFLMNRMDDALDFYRQGLALAEKQGEWQSAAYSLGQIGMILQRSKNQSAALQHYNQALEMFERVGDDKGKSSVLHQLGRIYQDMGELDKSLEYFLSAQKLREGRNDLPGLALGFGQLGILHMERQEYEAALRAAAQAYVLFTKLNSQGVLTVRKTLTSLREKVSPELFDAVFTEFNIRR